MSQKESEWELELRDMIDGIAAYKHDVGDRAVLLVKKVISNREKEIAEEVEGSVYAAFFSEAGEDDFEEYNNWRKNVLPGIILKHQ